MSPDDIVALAFHECTRGLSGTERASFDRHGVNGERLAYPDPLLPAPVAFDDVGGFGFPDDVRDQSALVSAFLVVVRDESGAACDLVAWRPQSGQVARYCRTAWALGMGEWPAPLSALRGDGAVTVFATPVEWLASGRRGLVILDAEIARWRLARDGGAIIAHSGAEHGRALERAIAVRPARVLIPRTLTFAKAA